MKKNRKAGQKRILLLILMIAGIIGVLLGFEYFIMDRVNREHAYQTAEVLIRHVENVLQTNTQKEQTQLEALKENYITKARAVSYILDRDPGSDRQIKELRQIASLLMIDEIHIFDAGGRLYSGTVPKYLGISFDSGEQIGYFKPMLTDIELTMCQDITPNTAEGKEMMYAICWNRTGERMIQIGIKPSRLLEELRHNEITEVISSIPVYDGIQILIAEKETGQIKAATNREDTGRTLSQLGISVQAALQKDYQGFASKANGQDVYCMFCRSGPYIIGILQDISVTNEEIPITMLIVFLYLLLAASALAVVIRKTAKHILNEKMNANTDALTGLNNRRCYEEDLKTIRQNPDYHRFFYFSFDVNGLKNVNDTFGHEAGDRLIQGAASVLGEVFGKYGTIYRTGGDEFSAFLFLNEKACVLAKKELEAGMGQWSRLNGRELSISCGYVSSKEFPDASPAELAKIADQRMYQSKKEYYESHGKDRRRQSS